MAIYDQIDIKIMHALNTDGRMSISDLSDKIGLSQTPTAKRVRRLEEIGLIDGYHASLNLSRLGGSLTVFTWVSLIDQKSETLAKFESLVASSPPIMDCHLMTGDADYLLRIAVDNLDEFEKFLTGAISSSEVVTNIRSSFALRSVALDRRPPALSH